LIFGEWYIKDFKKGASASIRRNLFIVWSYGREEINKTKSREKNR
jgi:hypothetical protein